MEPTEKACQRSQPSVKDTNEAPQNPAFTMSAEKSSSSVPTSLQDVEQCKTTKKIASPSKKKKNKQSNKKKNYSDPGSAPQTEENELVLSKPSTSKEHNVQSSRVDGIEDEASNSTNSQQAPENLQDCLSISQQRQPVRGGGAKVAHGQNYQKMVALLIIIKLHKNFLIEEGFKYCIQLEKGEYDKFDDIVIRYKRRDEKWFEICLQCKHTENPNLPINYSKLISCKGIKFNKDKGFLWKDYYSSFQTIEFNYNKPDQERIFALVTNNKFDNTFVSSDSAEKKINFEQCDSSGALLLCNYLKCESYKIISEDIQRASESFSIESEKDVKSAAMFLERMHLWCTIDTKHLEMEVKTELENFFNFKKNRRDLIFESLWYKVDTMYEKSSEITGKKIKLWFKMGTFINLPHSCDDFTGRKEQLKKVESKLKEKKKKDIDIVITGMPGMGKTQLILQYADLHQDQYDYICWINGTSPKTIFSSFNIIDNELNLPQHEKKESFNTREVSLKQIQQIYSSIPGHCLFIFDNGGTFLHDRNKNKLLLYLPQNKKDIEPRFIVTSTISDWTCSELIQLERFEEKEALEFLRSKLEEPVEYMNELSKIFNRWPLALNIASSFIKQQNRQTVDNKYSIQKFLKDYKDSPGDLHSTSGDWYKHSISSLWMVIKGKIKGNKDNGKNALLILNILSFCNSDNIPLSVFTEFHDDDILFLVDLALLQLDKDNCLLSIHCTLQTEIRRSLKNEKNKEKEAIELGLINFKEFFNNENITPSLQMKGALHAINYWKHSYGHVDLARKFSTMPKLILSFVKKFYGNQMEIQEFAKKAIKFLDEQKLGLEASQTRIEFAAFLELHGYYQQALQHVEYVLSIKDNTENKLDLCYLKIIQARVLKSLGYYPKALCILNELFLKDTNCNSFNITLQQEMASILNDMSKYEEALVIYDHVIKKSMEKLGDDHNVTFCSMNKKASVLQNMGRNGEALAIYDHVIKEKSKRFGDDHLDTLNSMHNKAYVLKVMGRYEEALAIYDHVIKKEREKVGDDHPDTLTSMNSKASLLDDMSKYEESLAIYDHVIKIRKQKLGEYHPDTLNSMHNKAYMLNKMDRYVEALAIYDHVIMVRREKLSEDHPDTLTSMNSKASLLDDMSKYEEALAMYDHVIKMRKEKLGEDHPDTLNSMHDKAKVLNKMDRYVEALAIYDELIKEEREKLGDDHPDTLRSMHNKASLLDNICKYEKALAIYDHVIMIRKVKLGENHTDTLNSMHRKAFVLNKMGKYEEALAIYNHVIKEQRKKLGDDHPDTLKSMHEKAYVLKKMGRYEEALAIYVDVITEESEQLGDDHPDILNSMNCMAALLHVMSKYEEALVIYDQVIKMKKEKLGEDNLETFNSIFDMASVLIKIGRYDEALAIYNQVFKEESENDGDDYPDTLTSMNNMASHFDDMCKYEEVLAIYDHMISMKKVKFGKNHHDTLNSIHNKAYILQKMGRYEEALEIYDHVIKEERKKVGEDHPDYLTSMNSKASLLHDMSEYEEALAIYDHVIKMRKEKLGEDHPDTFNSMHEKAYVLNKLGRYEEALAINDQVIMVRREKLIEDHPDTINSMIDKASVLNKMGRYKEALAIYDHVIKKESEKVGDDHPDTLTSMDCKASLLHDMSKYKEALAIYDHVIKMRIVKLGEDHPDTLNSMHDKASVLKKMGSYEEALAIYKHVIMVRKEKLSEDHPDTLTSMNSKASLLDDMSKYEEALAIYDHVIQMMKEKLGENHPDTLNSMHDKAHVLKKMGSFEEALSIYDHVIKKQTKKLGDDHPDTLRSMHNEASLLDDMRKHEEAHTIFDHVIKMRKEKLGEDHPDTILSMQKKASLLDKNLQI